MTQLSLLNDAGPLLTLGQLESHLWEAANILILDPREGETIYDPACGTGDMLLEAVYLCASAAVTLEAEEKICGSFKTPS